MATLAEAQAKWERNTAQAGERWKAAVERNGGRYCEGVARFLGISPASCQALRGRNYTAGVGAVGAAEFQQSISGKGSKWAENLRRAFGG